MQKSHFHNSHRHVCNLKFSIPTTILLMNTLDKFRNP